MKTLNELEVESGKKTHYVFKELYDSEYWPYIVAYLDNMKMNASITLNNVDLDKETHKAAKIQGIISGLEYLGVYTKSCVEKVQTEEKDK